MECRFLFPVETRPIYDALLIGFGPKGVGF
jgi:hypothetical protein